jgi:3-oxoacyl-[acyl-carrier protein] reductase
MQKLLLDQTALVTGGTAGIGRSIALKFAEQGAYVALFGTNNERGRETVSAILQLPENRGADYYQINVANRLEVERGVQQVLEARGNVDILVNNAGITRDQLLMKMSEEDWDSVMSVNVKSCYNTCKSLVRTFLKARKGKIINIGSVVGLVGNPGQVNYAASKAAIIGLTKALAKELATRNICVNCVAPGYIATAMTEVLTDAQKKSTLEAIPLGRMGTPEEVANAVLFLASALSDYITGEVIRVDGGMAM